MSDLSGPQRESLRRLAALVAGGAPSWEVFAAVAYEVAQVTGSALVQIQRYEPDDTVTVAGAWGAAPHPFQPGRAGTGRPRRSRRRSNAPASRCGWTTSARAAARSGRV